MNNFPALAAIAAIVCGAAVGSAEAATPVPAASPAASAASAAPPAPPRRQRPATSPAVKAAQGTVAPGELRPENPVVPQIAVPLRRPRDSGPPSPGAIHDDAARCRAATNDRERAACIRSGSVSGEPEKR